MQNCRLIIRFGIDSSDKSLIKSSLFFSLVYCQTVKSVCFFLLGNQMRNNTNKVGTTLHFKTFLLSFFYYNSYKMHPLLNIPLLSIVLRKEDLSEERECALQRVTVIISAFNINIDINV